MEYSVNGSNGEVIKHPPVNNSLDEIKTMAEAQYAHIRFIRAGHQLGPTPMLELLSPHNGGSMEPVNGWTSPCIIVGGIEKCRVDFSSMCWFYGRNVYSALAAQGKPRPIGLIEDCWSGSPDEQWSSRDALAKCLDPTKKITDGGMWNGMIRPVLNTTIKGAIWYQGESDASHPGPPGYDGYNCTFPAMIADWRAKWHESTGGQTDPQFPFGIVQLNSIGNGTVYHNPAEDFPANDFSAAYGYAGLRWSQSAGYGYVPNRALPNTFMAVSMDTPDRPYPFTGINGNHDEGFNVHSPFKQPTAARLARAGLALVYGVGDVAMDTTGPLPGQITRVVDPGNGLEQLILSVKNVGGGVAPLRSERGFEAFSCSDATHKKGTCHWVSAQATKANSTAVWISGVPTNATKLRYNWYSNPCGMNCFGCAVYVNAKPIGGLSGEEDFLPLPPFIAEL
jgi:sialate O-acetylesterase